MKWVWDVQSQVEYGLMAGGYVLVYVGGSWVLFYGLDLVVGSLSLL